MGIGALDAGSGLYSRGLAQPTAPVRIAILLDADDEFEPGGNRGLTMLYDATPDALVKLRANCAMRLWTL